MARSLADTETVTAVSTQASTSWKDGKFDSGTGARAFTSEVPFTRSFGESGPDAGPLTAAAALLTSYLHLSHSAPAICAGRSQNTARGGELRDPRLLLGCALRHGVHHHSVRSTPSCAWTLAGDSIAKVDTGSRHSPQVHHIRHDADSRVGGVDPGALHATLTGSHGGRYRHLLLAGPR